MINAFTKFSNLKIVLFVPLIYCLVMVSNKANAQDQQISGKVTDEFSEGLPGASILIKGTTAGTVTDQSGNYTISAASSDVLVVSFIGYITQEITIGSQTTINVSLDIDLEQLEEVVVVGYGTQRRADVTGAIGSIDAEAINAVPVATLDQALQGRASGVTVINTGSPGTNPSIRIRGLGTVNNNEPLYVVDGVISSGIAGLNPADIESVQVLKDASTAAVYGAKGSNGVVLITTKSGQSGAVKVTLNSYIGSQWNNERYDVLNTDQYMDFATQAFGAPPRFSDPNYASLFNNNTNWQDEIFQNGNMQNHNVSISGGGEKATFRLSGGYLQQDGVIKGTSYERYNFRANSNYSLGKLAVGQTLSLAFSKQVPEVNGGGRSLIEHAIKMAPYFPVYNSNNLGGFQGPNSPLDGQDAENPVRLIELNSLENNGVNILGNIFAEYEIIKGLKFKTQVGMEYTTIDYNSIFPSFDDDNVPEDMGSSGGTHQQAFAIISKSNSILQTVVLTNSLFYEKTLADKHNIGILLLAEKTDTEVKTTNTSSQDNLADDINQVSNTAANVGSFSSDYIRIGYLGRINYNYDGKYLLAASMRRDASSRFGPDNRWGTFPSVAAGWRVSEEAFLSNVSVISNFKIRASWGKTGNDNISDYGFTTGVNANFHYPIGGNDAQGAVPAGLSNSALKWEETTMTNIGLDAGFLDDRITLSLEYYINKSDDLLMPRQLPVSSGFDNPSIIENVGSMESKGFEINLGYHDFEGELQWSADLNLSTSKNEVLNLGENEAISGGGFENENITRLEPGNPAYQFYGWQFDGIFQTQAEVDAHAGGSQFSNLNAEPGDFRIVDTNGDGEINADDRTFIGNPFPTFTFGLNLSASYRGFDFSLFLNGVSGNDVYNTNIYDLEGMPRLFNSGVGVIDRWTGPGTSNTVPRAGGAPSNIQVSSRFVEDGSFTRLRNVTLGYDLASGILKDKLPKLRVYVSGVNLLTFTDYSGLDPEIGNYTVSAARSVPPAVGSVPTTGGGQPSANFGIGIDRGNYPIPKSFIIGVEVGF